MQQADSTVYHFEEDAAASAPQHVFHRPATPYQAIRLLPRNASESAKDSIVQRYFEPVILQPSARPDTLGLPGLKGSLSDWKDVPSYRDNFFTDNPYLHPELKVTLTGVPGDPVPYRLSDDVFITSTLLVSFFVAIFIIARSLHVMLLQLKNFFYNRDRKEVIMLKSDSEMKNQAFVVLLACFLMSILFFSYTEVRMPSVFNQVSPYKLLLLDMGIFISYFVLKYILYGIVNWTYFAPAKRSAWINAFNLVILVKALLLFVLTLLVVYFDLSHEAAVWAFLSIFALGEILMIFKTKQIFFSYRFGWLHLILYFCTLETTPLLLLWGALINFNELMIVYI